MIVTQTTAACSEPLTRTLPDYRNTEYICL
nr:MAG TPA_asm: hypothetical protein [Caudoviricetes sp.]